MVTIILDLQFGDTGKAKFIDYYIDQNSIDVSSRCVAGSNAGNTVVINNKKIILRQIPAGAHNPKTLCVLAQGMVIDPLVLKQEIKELNEYGVNLEGRLFVSNKAHLVMPYHILIDSHRENKTDKIGTTKRGIGPCFEDKVGRRGIKLGDLETDFNKAAIQAKNNYFRWLDAENIKRENKEISEDLLILRDYLQESKKILSIYLTDTSKFLHWLIDQNKSIVLCGSQGSQLDIDHGTYPFITSSSCVSAGLCAGTGIAPNQISEIIGVIKPYITRVGAGPFVTEIINNIADKIREVGAEYGSVTKRPRRIGWLNLVELKEAIKINGCTSLSLAKLDVLSCLSKIKICVNMENDNPIYLTMDGWEENIASVRSFKDLPLEAQEYISFIEEYLDIPIKMIGVGPNRDQTIIKN